MASGDVRFRVTEEGYNELRAMLKEPDPWLREPYRDGMKRIGEVAALAVTAAAPIGSTGRTVNSVRSVVSSARVPRFVRIDELAQSPKGFAYPRILEFSPYAQSRYKAGTNRHRLWMRLAIERVKPAIDQIFDQTADEVERRWSAQ